MFDIEKFKDYYPENYAEVKKAYELAAAAHDGQVRKSGQPYITHPEAVAQIVAEIGFDYQTVIAAFLHDVLEDTPVTAEQISEQFGDEILQLVQGVTKLDKLKFSTTEDAQAENFRKMFFAMAKDLRVIIIKFADRLHNMRSLSFQPPEKQQSIAKETLEIYAPLAGRLGISFFKCELEDLAMSYIYPKEYNYIANYVKENNSECEEFLRNICSQIHDKLDELGIDGEVSSRSKHFYSIFKKMRNLHIDIDQIYDLLAVRIIVNDIKECYTMLGQIHTMWKPIPNRVKDYIAVPKANNYQSLHTTVMTQYGKTFEVQIRTKEMHRIAEYGVAAHWKYKEGRTSTADTVLDEKVRWLREVMDAEKDVVGARDFMDSVKINVFDDEVFVFTPKGDVYDLPEGSTPIDLAYKIHSAIGNKCVGARINKKIVPLSTSLQNGDIVEILTSEASKGPSRDWLSFAHTASAKSKIRAFFKREMKEENVKRGKDMLEREARHRGYSFSDLLQTPSALETLLQRQSCATLDDLYSAVGYGGITTNQILIKLIDSFKAHAHEVASKAPLTDGELMPEREEKPRHPSKSGVLIKGFADFSVRLSHCCSPVPGDKIVGYISRGRGVSVHRADCPNLKSMEPERLIEATWDTFAIKDSYQATIKILCENKSGMLASVSAAIAALKMQICGINVTLNKKDDTAEIIVTVEIKKTSELDDLIRKLNSLSGIIEIRR